jgi:hypothetical protein
MRCSGRWIPRRKRSGAEPRPPIPPWAPWTSRRADLRAGRGGVDRPPSPGPVRGGHRDGCAHRGGGVGPEPRPRGLRRGPGGGGRRAPGRAHAESQAWHAASGGRTDALVVVRLPGRGGHQQRAALRRGGGAPPRRRDAQRPRARALPGARRRRRRAARGRRRPARCWAGRSRRCSGSRQSRATWSPSPSAATSAPLPAPP